jgi:hypothetical protein
MRERKVVKLAKVTLNETQMERLRTGQALIINLSDTKLELRAEKKNPLQDLLNEFFSTWR